MPAPEQAFNLRHLRAFCEVADAGSITAAAASVFLSQPAITQALAKLEHQLGVMLFIRKPAGMFMTEPGRIFRKRAVRALRNIDEGARRATRAGARGRSAGFAEFSRLLTIAQLRTLLAVSETGNFSWAAANLGVSRPSLHRSAGDLERLSGITLFRKTVQGFELTPAAQYLAQYSRLAFAELRQALAEISAFKGHDVSELAIGTLPLARSFVLPRAINELTRLRPGVRVRVVDGPYTDLLHGLRHGHLDMLIGALREPPPVDDIAQSELFRDELAIVGRAGHPLTRKSNPRMQEFAEYPWVTPARGIPTRDHFDAMFREAGITPPENLIETSSLILIRGLLLGSDRLTMISAHQIQHEIEQGLLHVLDSQIAQDARPIGITVRRDWQPTPTQSLFRDLIKEASEARPERGRGTNARPRTAGM